jgi:hypothetical protein
MLAGIIFSIALGAAGQAATLTAGCEQCHIVLHRGPSDLHVAKWMTSEHAAHRVGCVRCHNGDAASIDPLEAHRFVQPAQVRTSSVNRRQLPGTCGQCHPREATQFTTSRHGALLASDAAGAPSCGSCHDAMSARVPSPPALQAACARCHLDDPARSHFPSDARVLTEWLATLRERLAQIEPAVGRVPSDVARRTLGDRRARAEDSLMQARGSLHGFDLVAARAALQRSRTELSAIEQALGAENGR